MLRGVKNEIPHAPPPLSNGLGAQREPPRPSRGVDGRGGLVGKIPAMTDFRARGTIMGPTGLTAVFGMGTGVTPPVSSPEISPPGGQAGRGVECFGRLVTL